MIRSNKYEKNICVTVVVPVETGFEMSKPNTHTTNVTTNPTMNHLLIGLDAPIPLLTRRQLHNHYVFPQPVRILSTEIVVGVQPKFVAADDHGDLIHKKSVPVLVTHTLAQCSHVGTCLKQDLVLKDLLFISFIKQYRLPLYSYFVPCCGAPASSYQHPPASSCSCFACASSVVITELS